MESISDITRLRRIVANWRREGALVGFVPTMGALHAGHLSLVRIARERADRVVASVFVNPTQFGPHEDLARYPRTPERDAALLAEAGCHLLFLPAVETIYPPGFATFVEPGGAARGLESDLRPGHFRGVATVVMQLFHLVHPDLAVFGEKDAQQLAVVRQLVRDLHLPVEIVAGPTVREADGLAMSSRNAYLDAEQRRAAAVLHRALGDAESLIAGGERRAAAVCERLRATLAAEPRVTIDYVAAVDADTFQPLETLSGTVVLPIAVRLGGTRLIDNLRLRVTSAGVSSPIPHSPLLTT
ncbi:MAG TPA: pantoate--beta-alanine ligase [Thermoanaerobaculia bacterium]|jgi:pantoate--beta-alanine ligase|nr:pantoate--beta-alanine ligase [Thermoanaerobaculia bacterium]